MAIRSDLSARTAKAVAVVTTLVLLVAPVGLTAAAVAAGIFQSMDGSWRGDGSIKWYDGTTESLRCTAKNDVTDDGNKLNQDLKCASASGSAPLNIVTDISYRAAAGVVVGTWYEKNYFKGGGGHISGSATGSKISALVSIPSSNISVHVSVITSGGQQTVTMSITSPEGQTEISAKMRKG